MYGFLLARVDRATMPTPYQLMGGAAGVERLVDAFFDVLDAEPAYASLRARHPADLAPMRRGLKAWMLAWLGRPRTPGRSAATAPSILEVYAGTPLDAGAAGLWMAAMRHALVHADVARRVIDVVDPALAVICEGLRTDYGSDAMLLADNAA